MRFATAPVRAPGAPGAPARDRHLAVVDPEARKRERRARLGVRLAVASVIAAVLIVVGFHVVMAEGQLQLDRLNRATAQEQDRYEALLLKYSNRTSPRAIVARAKSMGMVAANNPRYVSAPGLTAEDAEKAGTDATMPSQAGDWGKVKQHLVAQP